MVLRTGGDFSLNDVRLLSFHLQKWYKGDGRLELYCLCDKVDTPHKFDGVMLWPMYDTRWERWWCKMNLFSPEMNISRPFLYMDLDTAVVGDLQGILPPDNPNEFITLGGFNPEVEMYLLSGMMWFPEQSDKVEKIWMEWISNTKEIIERFTPDGGDQAFIKSVVDHPDRYFQRLVPGKIHNGKPRGGTLQTLPREGSIICFHGQPRIPEAGKRVDWVKHYINESKR